MAKTISELTAASNANLTDLYETSQVSGEVYVSKSVSLQQLRNITNLTPSSTKTTAYTIATTDLGNVIRMNSNSGEPVDLNMPARGTLALPLGFNFFLLVVGDDTTVLTPLGGSDTIIGINEIETGEIVQVILTDISGSTNEWTASSLPAYGYTTITSSSLAVLQLPLFNIYDITMSASNQSVQLPDMHLDNSPKVGQIFYIRNAGSSNSFKIILNDGTTVLVSLVLPGDTVMLWLTNNSSSNGVLEYQLIPAYSNNTTFTTNFTGLGFTLTAVPISFSKVGNIVTANVGVATGNYAGNQTIAATLNSSTPIPAAYRPSAFQGAALGTSFAVDDGFYAIGGAWPGSFTVDYLGNIVISVADGYAYSGVGNGGFIAFSVSWNTL